MSVAHLRCFQPLAQNADAPRKAPVRRRAGARLFRGQGRHVASAELSPAQVQTTLVFLAAAAAGATALYTALKVCAVLLWTPAGMHEREVACFLARVHRRTRSRAQHASPQVRSRPCDVPDPHVTNSPRAGGVRCFACTGSGEVAARDRCDATSLALGPVHADASRGSNDQASSCARGAAGVVSPSRSSKNTIERGHFSRPRVQHCATQWERNQHSRGAGRLRRPHLSHLSSQIPPLSRTAAPSWCLTACWPRSRCSTGRNRS